MKQSFNIRKGIYVVPGIGRVIATKPLTEEQLVELYLNSKFPFIELEAKGVQILKKQKLTNEQVASLIVNAKSVEEIDLLLEVKNNKTLEGIAETKKAAFKS